MKRNIARMCVSFCKIVEGIVGVFSLGYYVPDFVYESSVYFARKDWFSKKGNNNDLLSQTT